MAHSLFACSCGMAGKSYQYKVSPYILNSVIFFIMMSDHGICQIDTPSSVQKIKEIEPEIFYVDIFINNMPQKGVFQLVKVGDDYWFPSDQLGVFNLKDASSLTKQFFFDRQFSLLPSYMSIKINNSDLSATINIPAEFMAVTIIKDEATHLMPAPATYAFYWNYDLSIYHQPFLYQAQLLTAHKPVITSPFGSISNQFMTNTGLRNNIVRLETSYLKDVPSWQLRITAGDFATDAPSFISSVPAAGIKIAKGLLFQSGSLSFPSLDLTGFTPQPATAEIWINDALRMKKDLPMGGFLLDNLNLPQGANQGELVIKGVDGLISSIPFSYYGDPEFLRPNFSSFSYGLGFLRKDYGTKSFSYSDPAFFGSHKLGVNNFWTTSFHTQLSPKIALMAFEQRFKLSSIGATAFATSASASSLGVGFLLSPQLQLDIWPVNFRARALLSSAKYNPISTQEKKGLLPSVNINCGLRFDLPYFKYSGINYLMLQNENRINHLLGLRQGFPIFYDLATSLTVDYEFTQKNLLFFASVSYQLFDRHRVSVQTNKNQHMETIAGLHGSSDPNNAQMLSYNVNTKIDSYHAQGNLNYENNYLRSHLNILSSKQTLAYNTSLAGSFQVMKNNLFFSRQVEKGLLLIELPGQNGVQIIKDNAKILGKTNSRGFLLVPNLEPYYLARLGVDAKDLSIFASSNDFNGGIELIPGFQTAHEIKFAAKMVRYVHFNLLQGQKRLLPGTKINIVDEQPSFVMQDGDIYLEVADNKTTINGRNEDNNCAFELTLAPKKPDDIIEELGDIQCAP